MADLDFSGQAEPVAHDALDFSAQAVPAPRLLDALGGDTSGGGPGTLLQSSGKRPLADLGLAMALGQDADPLNPVRDAASAALTNVLKANPDLSQEDASRLAFNEVAKTATPEQLKNPAFGTAIASTIRNSFGGKFADSLGSPNTPQPYQEGGPAAAAAAYMSGFSKPLASAAAVPVGLAGGLAGALGQGGSGMQDALFKTYTQMSDAGQNPGGEDVIARSPIAGGLGELGGSLASFGLTPGVSGASELPALANLAQGGRAAKALAPILEHVIGNAPGALAAGGLPSGSEAAQRTLEEGGTLPQAYGEAAAGAGFGTAQFLAPASLEGNIAVRAASGAAIQQGLSAAQQQSQHAIAPDIFQPAQAPDLSNPMTYMGAILGATGKGGILGHVEGYADPNIAALRDVGSLGDTPVTPEGPRALPAPDFSVEATPAAPAAAAPADFNPQMAAAGFRADPRTALAALDHPTLVDVAKKAGFVVKADDSAPTIIGKVMKLSTDDLHSDVLPEYMAAITPAVASRPVETNPVVSQETPNPVDNVPPASLASAIAPGATLPVDSTGTAFTPQQGLASLSDALAKRATGGEQLPAPVTTVDPAGVAKTSNDYLTLARQAMDQAQAAHEAEMQKRDMGLTPDIVRTQAPKWEAARAKAQDIQDKLDAQPDDELATQRDDDSPPWWVAGQHAEDELSQQQASGSRDLSTEVNAPKEPELPDAPYDMTPEELSAHADAVAGHGKAVEDAILGDKADEWRAAQRQFQSSNDAIADKGETTFKSIESKLSPKNRDLLYGIGESDEAHDDFQDFRDAHQDAATAGTPEEATTVLSRFLPTLGNTKGGDPAQWTRKQQVAYAGMRTLREKIAENGWDSSAIQKNALHRAASRYSDSTDMEAMLDRFMKTEQRKPAQPATPALEAPAKEPARIGSESVSTEKEYGKNPVPESTDGHGTQASWVIRNKETGESVMETFDRKKVQYLNTEKYEAVPVRQHLAEANDPESRIGKLIRGKSSTPAKVEQTVNDSDEGGVPPALRRPDWTPKVEKKALTEIDSLVEKFGGSTLADSIAQDFHEHQGAALIGKTITSHEDLAAMASVYRNPAFETMRYMYVDDAGTVLGETAVSSRMPSSATAFPTGEDDGAIWLIKAAPKGATGIWMVHNHPSGNPRPSNADLEVTGQLAIQLGDIPRAPKVKGHVVLDHDTFGRISPGGEDRGIGKLPDSGPDPLREKRGAELFDVRMSSPAFAASTGKQIAAMTPEDSIAVVVMAANGNVVSVHTFPNGVLVGPKGAALLARLGAKRGAVGLGIVTSSDNFAKYRDAFNSASDRNLLYDAVVVTPSGHALQLGNHPDLMETRSTFGKHSAAAVKRGDSGTRVYEPEAGTEPPRISFNMVREALRNRGMSEESIRSMSDEDMFAEQANLRMRSAPTPEQKVTGVKNATVDEERFLRGKDAIEFDRKRSDAELESEAKRRLAEDPGLGASIAASVVAKPRVLSDFDTAVLSADRIRLKSSFIQAEQAVDDAMTSGDEVAEGVARARLETVEAQMDVADNAARLSGTEAGRSLRSRQLMFNDDYSRATIARRARIKSGGEKLDVAVRGQLSAMAKRIEELDAKIDELKNGQINRRAGTLSPAKRKASDAEFKSLSDKLRGISSFDQLKAGCIA